MVSSLWFVIARNLTNIGKDLANLTSHLAQITTTTQVLFSTQQGPTSNTFIVQDQSQASHFQQPNLNFTHTASNFAASYLQQDHDVNSQVNPTSIYGGTRTPHLRDEHN